jgi:hypothetical protein
MLIVANVVRPRPLIKASLTKAFPAVQEQERCPLRGIRDTSGLNATMNACLVGVAAQGAIRDKQQIPLYR